MALRPLLLDLLLPQRCPGCAAGHASCARQVAGLCVECTEAAGSLCCPDLAPVVLAPGLLAVGAFAYDGVVAEAVRTVKRPGRHAAAAGLGRLMWQVVRTGLADDHGFDVAGLPVTWVPSSPRARRERGAQIPRLLAGGTARPLLVCPRDRPDQTSLDAVGRRRNPVGAFAATARVPPTVVLVDDVRTTGATLTAAGEALLHAGARRVLAVTFAVAGGEFSTL